MFSQADFFMASFDGYLGTVKTVPYIEKNETFSFKFNTLTYNKGVWKSERLEKYMI